MVAVGAQGGSSEWSGDVGGYGAEAVGLSGLVERGHDA